MTLHILHIEDEADIRLIVEIALEEGDFRLVQCPSGNDALSRAPDLSPDLMLIDVMMPGMDGPTTLAGLRALPHLAHTPVIFMTAKVRPAEIAQLEALGAIGVITKPFDPMRLGDEIRALLGHPAV